MSAPKHEQKPVTLGYETTQRDIRADRSYSSSAYGVRESGRVEWVDQAQNPFDSVGLGHRRATPLGTHDGKRTEAEWDDELGFRYRPRFDGV